MTAKYRPPIGFPICWYPGADKRIDPTAAVVVGYTGDLLIIETVDTNGSHRIRRDQRHMEDPVI